MADPVDLFRRDYFPACYHGSTREGPNQWPPKYIVIHCTENPNPEDPDSIESTGAWFQAKNPDGSCKAKGSTHFGVDLNSTQLFLEDITEAAGAPPLNDCGLHIEQAGQAKYTRAQWMELEPTIIRCAFVVATWCKTYSIPVKFLSVADLKAAGDHPAKPQGITTHANVSDAWHQSSHWDPGGGYPVDVFMAHVQSFMEEEEPEMPFTPAEEAELRKLLPVAGPLRGVGEAVKKKATPDYEPPKDWTGIYYQTTLEGLEPGGSDPDALKVGEAVVLQRPE